MLAPPRFLSVAAALIVALALASLGRAQDAASDKASGLFDKGQTQYKAMEFRQAKETLLSVDRAKLSADKQKVLDQYLDKVDGAITQQSAAAEAFKSAEKALAANDLAKAKDGYAAAAANEYFQPAMRDAAKAQLALVDDRIKKAAEASVPPPVKTNPPVVKTDPPPVKTNPPVVAADPPVVKTPPPVTTAPAPNQESKVVVADDHRSLPPVKDNPPVLTRSQKEAELAIQEANLEFQKRMTEISERLIGADSDKDFDAAAATCKEAKEVLEANRCFYPADQYRRRMARVETQAEDIEKARKQWSERKDEKIRVEIAREESARALQTQARKVNEIAHLMGEAKHLIVQKEYAKALDVMKQIAVLDPHNPWVEEHQSMLTELQFLRERREIDLKYRENEQLQMNAVAEAEIPWFVTLIYPEDWPEKTLQRKAYEVTSGSTSESDRATAAKLKQRIPKLDFEDTEFQAVITFLREMSNLNINPNWTALEAAGIAKTAKVSLHLTDVTFEKALRTLLGNLGGGTTALNFVVDDGVVTISTKEDLSQKTVIRLYDINDLIVRYPMFSGPVMDLSNTIANVAGNGSGSSGGGGLFGSSSGCSSGNTSSEDCTPSKSEVIQKIIATIKGAVEPDSWKPEGTVGIINDFNGNLTVLQTADAQAKVADVLTQFREFKSIEISVEARFVQVSSGFLESIGLNLDMYFNLGSQLGSTSTNDPWTGTSLGTGQAPGPTATPATPWIGATVPQKGGTSGWGTGPPGTNFLTPIVVQQNSTTFTNMLGSGTGMASQVTTPSMQVGGTFLDDVQVNFLLQATQANQTTRTLTAPHITLSNGQRAYVTVGTEQAYISSFEPVVSSNATALQPIVSWVPTGSVLDVEAVASADRRYVTMTVRPQVSVLNSMTDFNLGSYGELQLPNVTIQMLETTVCVPDGGTLLLGGQKLSTEVEREQGVPLLSKIPIISRAFTNRGMTRDDTTLLILVKPKILIMQEQETKAFPQP